MNNRIEDLAWKLCYALFGTDSTDGPIPVELLPEDVQDIAHEFLAALSLAATERAAATLYDWDGAPEDAGWAATDASGEAWWYAIKPVRVHTRNEWINEDIVPATGIDPAHILRRVDWRESLEARP